MASLAKSAGSGESNKSICCENTTAWQLLLLLLKVSVNVIALSLAPNNSTIRTTDRTPAITVRYHEGPGLGLAWLRYGPSIELIRVWCILHACRKSRAIARHGTVFKRARRAYGRIPVDFQITSNESCSSNRSATNPILSLADLGRPRGGRARTMGRPGQAVVTVATLQRSSSSSENVSKSWPCLEATKSRVFHCSPVKRRPALTRTTGITTIR